MARPKDSVLRMLNGDIESPPPRSAPSPDQATAELLDDLDGDMPPDPAPRKPRASVKRASAAKVKIVRDELHVMMMLGAGTLSVRDPYCGGVLNAQSEAIAAALADILATKPAVLRWFEGMSGLGGYMRLFVALKPLVEAIAAHHVTKTVREETDSDGATDPLAEFPAFRPGERYTA